MLNLTMGSGNFFSLLIFRLGLGLIVLRKKDKQLLKERKFKQKMHGLRLKLIIALEIMLNLKNLANRPSR